MVDDDVLQGQVSGLLTAGPGVVPVPVPVAIHPDVQVEHLDASSQQSLLGLVVDQPHPDLHPGRLAVGQGDGRALQAIVEAIPIPHALARQDVVGGVRVRAGVGLRLHAHARAQMHRPGMTVQRTGCLAGQAGEDRGEARGNTRVGGHGETSVVAAVRRIPQVVGPHWDGHGHLVRGLGDSLARVRRAGDVGADPRRGSAARGLVGDLELALGLARRGGADPLPAHEQAVDQVGFQGRVPVQEGLHAEALTHPQGLIQVADLAGLQPEDADASPGGVQAGAAGISHPGSGHAQEDGHRRVVAETGAQDQLLARHQHGQVGRPGRLLALEDALGHLDVVQAGQLAVDPQGGLRLEGAAVRAAGCRGHGPVPEAVPAIVHLHGHVQEEGGVAGQLPLPAHGPPLALGPHGAGGLARGGAQSRAPGQGEAGRQGPDEPGGHRPAAAGVGQGQGDGHPIPGTDRRSRGHARLHRQVQGRRGQGGEGEE